MGKKSKTGKTRKDQYYYDAKSMGFRARSSFKLIEINKRFHFLEKATILIDLCAAPGSWMQVASQVMPKSSIIIGVDLVHIESIPNTISIKADITTEECKTLIKKEIKTAKAQVVLHDGAPNVGANWNVDEFQQCLLCYKAFMLATEFLVKNGTFVTKVFRSKDYNSLMWLLNNFFDKIQTVKPSSSRNESAEIFLVCLNYKAPTTIAPEFRDLKFVFKDVDTPENNDLTFERVAKMSKKAVGYEDNLYKEVLVTDLLLAEKPMNILLTSNKLILNDEDVANHESVTLEIKQYIVDLKLLGKHDFKKLKNWLKKVIPFYKQKMNIEQEVVDKEPEAPKTEEEKLDIDIKNCESEIVRNVKKRAKKERKEKMKKVKEIQLSMLHVGDTIQQVEDNDLFTASHHQNRIDKGLIPIDVPVSTLDKFIGEQEHRRSVLKGVKLANKVRYDKEGDHDYDTNIEMANRMDLSEDDDSDPEQSSEDERLEHDTDDDDSNVEIDLDNVDLLKNPNENSDEEEDEECDDDDEECDEDDEAMDCDVEDESLNSEEEMKEIEDEEKERMSRKRKISAVTDLNYDPNAISSVAKRSKKVKQFFDQDEIKYLMNEDSSDENEDEDEIVQEIKETKHIDEKVNKRKDIDFSNDPEKMSKMKNLSNTLNLKLNDRDRALAVEWIKSAKNRREMLDWSYNKYMQDDEGVPKWLLEEERKHMRPVLPFIDEQKIKAAKETVSTNINKRTIKKVEQAKARKKIHLMRRLSKLNKRTSGKMKDDELTEMEKAKNLKELNKRVNLLHNKKKPTTIEVTNRSGKRSRVGKYQKGAKVKVVDRRQKSDGRVIDAKKKKKSNR